MRRCCMLSKISFLYLSVSPWVCQFFLTLSHYGPTKYQETFIFSHFISNKRTVMSISTACLRSHRQYEKSLRFNSKCFWLKSQWIFNSTMMNLYYPFLVSFPLFLCITPFNWILLYCSSGQRNNCTCISSISISFHLCILYILPALNNPQYQLSMSRGIVFIHSFIHQFNRSIIIPFINNSTNICEPSIMHQAPWWKSQI